MTNKYCAYHTCKSDSRKDKSIKWAKFVSKYKDLERHEKWIKQLNRRPDYDFGRHLFICDKHFPPDTDLNYDTNPDLLPEAEQNPEPLKASKMRRSEVDILEEMIDKRSRISPPKTIQKVREPTIGEIMDSDYERKLNPNKGITIVISKPAPKPKPKLPEKMTTNTSWQCDCLYTCTSKEKLLQHIKTVHTSQEVAEIDPVIQIVYKAKLKPVEVKNAKEVIYPVHKVEVVEHRKAENMLENPDIPENILSDVLGKNEVLEDHELLEDPLSI